MTDIKRFKVDNVYYNIEDETSRDTLDTKQDTLVSGTNIKTINGTSILGSGDIPVGGAAVWGGITGTLSSQTDLQTALDGKLGTAHNADAAAHADIRTSVTSEATARTAADANLQTQIDALEAKALVKDIVGTHAALLAYDVSKLAVDDRIQVLQDETHSNANAYYRYTGGAQTTCWEFIGSTAETYTKSESDARFVPQTRTVNSKALSADISLTYADVGALSSSATLADLSDDSTHRTVTDTEKSSWNDKVDKVAGKQLSTEDFTSALKTKLEGVEEGAQVNVQSDWNATSGDALILNKPVVPTKTSELTNDSGFQTASDVSTAVSTHNSASDAHQTLFDAKLSIEGTTESPYTEGYIVKVGSDKKLHVVAGGTSSVAWADVSNKPFSAVGAGLTVDSDALKVNVGTAENTICAGDDPRLSDARSPTVHAITHTDGTDDIQTANASQKGLLSSADWATFNAKQDALTIDTALDTSSSNPVQNKVIATAVNGKVDKETGKGLSTNDYTSAEKTKVSGIETGAEVNVIETVKRNGTALTVTGKAVDITVPTALSSLSDDSTHRLVTDTEKSTWNGKQNALTFDSAPTASSTNPVTSGGIYTAIDVKVDKVSGKGLSTNDYTTAEKTKLSGIAEGAQVNVLEGVKDASGNDLTITSKKVTLSKSAVGLGNVDNTSDADKPISTATQTALNGKEDAIGTKGTAFNKSFGTAAGTVCEGNDSRLTDSRTPKAHKATHTKDGSDELSLDATQITSGVLDVDRVPRAAFQKMVTVADETARLALTTAQVTTGDTVLQSDTSVMYFVKDDTKLGTEAAFQVYLTTVAWASVTGKPSSFTPSAHASTHGVGQSDALSLAASQITSGQIAYARIPVGSTENTICAGDDSRLSDARTPKVHASAHATGGSDPVTPADIGAATTASVTTVSTNLSTHLSASNPHGITKSTIGLGNVDNTSDADKPISDATQTALDAKEPKITTKNTAFNVDFGTTSGTACEGNDSRFTTMSNHIANTSNPHSVTAAQIGVDSGAQVNVIETVKVNGTTLTVTSKAVDVTVPTKVSALTNDSGYQTSANVTSAVSTHNSASDAHSSLFSAKQNSLPAAFLHVIPVNANLVKSNQDSTTKVYKDYTWTLTTSVSGYPDYWLSHLSDDFLTRTLTVKSGGASGTVLGTYTFTRTLDTDGNLLTETLN